MFTLNNTIDGLEVKYDGTAYAKLAALESIVTKWNDSREKVTWDDADVKFLDANSHGDDVNNCLSDLLRDDYADKYAENLKDVIRAVIEEIEYGAFIDVNRAYQAEHGNDWYWCRSEGIWKQWKPIA